MDADAFRRALNSLLPPAVAVLAASEAPDDFDAQFSAVGKTYRYRIVNRRDPAPLEAGRAWVINRHLDQESMTLSAHNLLGQHDFSSFRGSGCVASSPVRTLRRCDLESTGEVHTFELEADGFLRHMVRNVVGTLVEIGLGRFSTGDATAILEARDRRRAGATAPPQGLYLVSVDYPPGLGAWGRPE
jgi:tRNA pseudouridine38-40 synthase